jgi:hypothetical protein
MNLKAKKYKFIQKLFDVNKTLLRKLENVLRKETEEPQRISLEQYNKEINEAIEDVKNGNFYTHKEVGEHIKQW